MNTYIYVLYKFGNYESIYSSLDEDEVWKYFAKYIIKDEEYKWWFEKLNIKSSEELEGYEFDSEDMYELEHGILRVPLQIELE